MLIPRLQCCCAWGRREAQGSAVQPLTLQLGSLLGEFADDTNEGPVFILQPLIVRFQLRQYLHLFLHFREFPLQGSFLPFLHLQHARPVRSFLLFLLSCLFQLGFDVGQLELCFLQF